MCLQGGYALHFSPDSSLAIGFAVHPLPKFVASLLSGAGTPDDNPGTGFHLVNALSVSKDKILKDCSPAGTEGALDWEGVVSACQVVSADLLSKTEVDPATLGALPGIFSIKHSPVLRIQPVVVFRLPQDRGETLDEETHAVFEDIRVLCVTMMAAGLVLRPPSAERVNTFCPDVGTLVRRKKKEWEWERIPDWDWGRAALMVPRELRKTDLHPKELWASFLSQSAWTVEQVMPKTVRVCVRIDCVCTDASNKSGLTAGSSVSPSSTVVVQTARGGGGRGRRRPRREGLRYPHGLAGSVDAGVRGDLWT